MIYSIVTDKHIISPLDYNSAITAFATSEINCFIREQEDNIFGEVITEIEKNVDDDYAIYTLTRSKNSTPLMEYYNELSKIGRED